MHADKWDNNSQPPPLCQKLSVQRHVEKAPRSSTRPLMPPDPLDSGSIHINLTQLLNEIMPCVN
jgi:hypothetical protein